MKRRLPAQGPCRRLVLGYMQSRPFKTPERDTCDRLRKEIDDLAGTLLATEHFWEKPPTHEKPTGRELTSPAKIQLAHPLAGLHGPLQVLRAICRQKIQKALPATNGCCAEPLEA